MKEAAPLSIRDNSFSRRRNTPQHTCSGKTERGAIAVMSPFLILIILGFFALALDLSRVYNRRAELHIAADAAAIAAAKHLDGTKEGIEAALAAARGIVQSGANSPQYDYSEKMLWNDSAISFGASREGSGGWKAASEALNSPAGLLFVRVDTGALADAYGTVQMFFAPVLSSSLRSLKVAHIAVAGKGRLQITPFAVCAMSPTARAKRTSPSGTLYDELVEYGFRRGVSYNLMQLNPDNGSTAANFQVDPARLAGGTGTADHFASWIYRPYICSGTMAVSGVTGKKVRVQSPFPIGTYYTHLNSRFDPYTGACDVYSAPPDANVKQYPFASISWMNPKPVVQSAKNDLTSTTRMQTVADLGPPNHTATPDYGPLWSFARAVPWSSYEDKGAPEPAEGYTPFAATSTVWKALYGSDAGVSTYPASPPYLMNSGSAFFQAPTSARKPGVKYRRVLNIPLLSCPVSGSEATVLAIGKFLMTFPADSTSIYAEFGGITTEDRIGSLVEIYQ